MKGGAPNRREEDRRRRASGKEQGGETTRQDQGEDRAPRESKRCAPQGQKNSHKTLAFSAE
eukprot:1888971-Heterocapsa_arctica.AAC.1